MLDYQNTYNAIAIGQEFLKSSKTSPNLPNVIAYQGRFGSNDLNEFNIVTQNASLSKQERIAMSWPQFLKHYVVS